jgi:tetratricopeptide (TPR) repeat protein
MSDLLARLQAALGDAYRIEKELGGGGMSRLFLANEASLHRQVVIKLLPPEFTSEVSAARFKQEIELAAHLQHPNILPVLAAGSKDDLLYYVMPYVAGESLRHRLTREGKLPVSDAGRILHEVADALAYAHAEGVIHRDIKPENILLEGSHAVLADFGVARALTEARSGGRLTDTGISVGTPAYMSPEQAAGERHIDATADVYALAVVGYEMLAGLPPFQGPTAQAVMAAHMTATPRPLGDVRPDTPAEVEQAIMRALSKNPTARLRSAAEFREALGAPYGLATARRRLTPAWLAAGVVAVAAVAGAASLIARSRSRPVLDPNLVAVAPFDVLDAKLELWHEGLVDVLSRNLDGAGPLRTVSPTVVIRRWSGRADPASAAELGHRTGARLAVFGSLVGVGSDSVRLAATLLDVAASRSFGDIELRDGAGHVDRLADSLTLALLRELGRTRPIGAVRHTALGSKSLPALKAFLQGEQFFRRTAWDSALAYYERAIAADSTFALALRRISVVLGWQRVGVDSLSRAFALRAGDSNHGLAPRESLLVTADSLSAVMYAYPNDTLFFEHLSRLSAVLEETTRRYPDDPEAWYGLGDARYHFWAPGAVRQLVPALDAFDRSIALDSAFAPAYLHPIELAMARGDSARGLRYLRAYLALNPTDVDADGLRLAATLLDPAKAQTPDVQRVLDTASADLLFNAEVPFRFWPDSAETSVRLRRLFARAARAMGPPFTDPAFRRLALARGLAYRGHVREAYRTEGRAPPLWFAAVALLGGAPDDSVAAVFRGWLKERRPQAGLALPWWSARGDTALLQELASWADSLAGATRHEWERTRAHYTAAASRAYLALARKDTADALRRFVALPDSTWARSAFDGLVEAQLLAARHRDREAAAVLGPDFGAYFHPGEVLWRLERARVNERLGDREIALPDYRFVADIWRHADPELQTYVNEAQAALKRLGAEPRR